MDNGEKLLIYAPIIAGTFTISGAIHNNDFMLVLQSMSWGCACSLIIALCIKMIDKIDKVL